MAKVTFDTNDVAVLKALLWWCKGFSAAHHPGFCNMPNVIALGELMARMEKALKE